jgi:hypothetical protein
MADPPPYPGTPRWVKVFGFIVIALLLFIGLHLVGGSLLGHAFSGYDGHAPPFSATDHGREQP